VVGIASSATGAGVAAADTEGGPDLVPDGSLDGTTDLFLGEGGAGRSSPSDATFYLRNNGGGRHHLDVGGDVTGHPLSGTELVIDGATVVDPIGTWTGTGDMLPCSGCVTSSDLADESVTGSKIELGGVQSAHLGAGAVGAAQLADGAISAAKIAQQAVQSEHLAAGSVGSQAILDGTITAADVDPLGGVYSSKAALYEVSGRCFIPVGGSDACIVWCRDENDLPLQGCCGQSADDLVISSSAAWDWDDETEPARFVCIASNVTSAPAEVWTSLICIDVPGP